MKYPEQEQWSWQLRGKPVVLIALLGLSAVLVGLTVWQHTTDGKYWRVCAFFTSIVLLLTANLDFRLMFLRLYVGKEGIYCRTNPFFGRYYPYGQIIRAWKSEYTGNYIHFVLADDRVIHIPYASRRDEAGVACLLGQVEQARAGAEQEPRWDGILDGKDSLHVSMGMFFCIFAFLIGVAVFLLSTLEPGLALFEVCLILAFASGYLGMLCYTLFFFIRQQRLKVCIGREGFLIRTGLRKGRFYRYSEIASYREEQKLFNRRSRTYIYFFVFTLTNGKRHKFPFALSVYEREIELLKERIGEDKLVR